VEINKKAFEADRVIVTGALVYHVMSGWGGGRKSILPGIASRKSIMQNHGISISDTIGNGPNPSCDCALYEENPLNLDMVEAAELFSPDFMFNVILGDGRIIAAVSGDITQAHKKGCEMVSRFNDVPISEKADMIIASAGGYPKDINLYQSTKVIYNAMRALKDKGVMVVLAECNEGFGNPEVQHILQDYTSNLDREMELRNDYTISKYIGFLAAWYAEKYHIIYVSSINPDEVVSAGITVVSSVEEALKAAYQIKGTDQLATYIMPDGSAYPVLKS
jgi:nickel-dependent lactate racemase